MHKGKPEAFLPDSTCVSKKKHTLGGMNKDGNKKTENSDDIVIYHSDNGEMQIDVKLENETVWLTQTLCELYQTSKIALLNQINRISFTYKVSYSNREIKNYFEKFRRIWEKDKPLNITYIGFLLHMVLYKQYEETNFHAYNKGEWNNDPLNTFVFGDNILKTSGFPFSYDNINMSYPIYNNNFCNKFMLFMNIVRFRNNKDVSNWLLMLNSRNFYHLYTFSEKDNVTVEKYFKEIENYGIMARDNQNKK